MIKVVRWKWLANEKQQGKFIVLFNHILITKGRCKGRRFRIVKVNKKGYKYIMFLGKFTVDFIVDDYRTYLAKCNCQVI